MSQVKISGNASGTGVLTIAAPNTNTDRSITIPDKAGAIAVGAGTIVQVVQGTTSTEVAITSSTYTDTGITADITPTSSSNKILIMSCPFFDISRTADNQGAGFRLLRDSTVIHAPPEDGIGPVSEYINGVGGRDFWGVHTVIYMDSPATTSSTTYKIQARPYATTSTGTIKINRGIGSPTTNSVSTITLMEVVA